MNKFVRHILPPLLIALIIGGVANATAIKVWVTGEVLTASDLNAALYHIHTSLKGAAHTLIVAADIQSGAVTNAKLAGSIAHTKLLTPALVPKAYATAAICDSTQAAGTDCTINESSGVGFVEATGVSGTYQVKLDYVPNSATFAVVVSAYSNVYCSVASKAAGAVGTVHFQIKCWDAAGAAVNNEPFSFIVIGA